MKKVLLIALIFGFIQNSTWAQVSTMVQLDGSGGLKLDSTGVLYIADFGNFLSAGDGILNSVRTMTPDGSTSWYVGGFVSASGNAFDSEGIFYQSDIGSSQVFKVVEGEAEVYATENISGPVGLVFDPSDNLFVCNCSNNTIAKVTPEGISSVLASGSLFNCPNGITIDEEQNLYVSNFSDGRVIKIDSAGNASQFADIAGANNGHLEYCEADSNIYLCSHGSSSIYRLDLGGNAEVLAGTGNRGNDDGMPLESTFSRPNGIALTVTGDTIYINSSVPLLDTPGIPLNPSLIRRITGVQSGTLSVETVNPAAKRLHVFPNPSPTGRVKATGENLISLSVFSADGKLVGKLNVTNDVVEWQLESGTYLIIGTFRDGTTESQKAVVRQ